jgi:ABC-type multidrug transport system fused ATPase/permease subunit
MKTLIKVFSLIEKSEYKKIFFIFFLIVGNSFVEMTGIALIIPIINFLLLDNFQDFISRYDRYDLLAGKTDLQLFQFFLLLLILTTLFKVVFQILLTRQIGKFSGFQEANLSISLLRKYLQFPYIFFLKKNTSTIINELIQITSKFIYQILNPLITIFSDFFILFIVSIFLIIIDFRIYIFSSGLLIFFSFLYVFMVKSKMVKWGKDLNTFENEKINIIQQIFMSLRNFKLSTNQFTFFNTYSNFSHKKGKILMRYKSLVEAPRLLLELMIVVLFSFLLLHLMKLNYTNTQIVSTIGVYIVCIFRLMPTVNRLILNFQEIKYGKDSLTKLTEINKNFEIHKNDILIKKEVVKKKGNIKISEIFFKNVNFEYSHKNLVLKNINLKIYRGEIVGIVGKTGSGKTTFVDILCGLINPTKGEVLFDGINIYYNLNIFKHKIGYVPQAVFLNDTSILKNIAFGEKDDQINLKKVKKLIKCLDLESFVNDLPEKLNTLVGENGVRLSGGQRQRIGIARSLYHNPNVLIFDEATNALDIETERKVFKNLKYLLKGVTTFIVTHKLDTLKYCSKTIEVKNNEITIANN